VADSALGRSALLKVCFIKCLTWLCRLKSQSAIRRSRNLPSRSFTTLSCEMTWWHVVHDMLTLKTCTALSRTLPFRPCRHHIPCIQEQAGGERSWPFDAISSPYTSLTCRMWTFMAFWHCPRLLHPCTQDRTGGSFKQVVVPSVQLTMGHWRMSQEAAAIRSPAPLLIGTGYLRWVPVMLEHDHP
jgi:hypothetical protein